MNAALVRRRQLFCICLCGEKIDSADFVSSGCDCRDVRVGNLQNLTLKKKVLAELVQEAQTGAALQNLTLEI
jgi:hypothetical protein